LAKIWTNVFQKTAKDSLFLVENMAH
jgi:hypothetical protein